MLITQNHPEFNEIRWETWTPKDQATLCFVLRDQQEVLLIEKKRGLGMGKVNGPGGRMEPGETLEQCAVRETQEELGVTPLNPVARGVLRFQFKDGYSLEAHIFSATEWEGEAIETDEAVPLWTPLDLMPYRRMWADDVLWLPHMLDGKQVDGSFLFDDDKMLGCCLEVKGRKVTE
jgi:8-oxo-dGTP diphosphatase